jgi:hypothetical protein
VVLESSHLLLVTNGAVIGGAREFTSVVDVNSRAPPITAPLVTNNRCELESTTNYCSTSY